MIDWLFNWRAISLGAGILLAAIGLGIAFRDSSLGNIAGVVGLAVSVLGFVVTIWTVLDARQQIEEAGGRAEKAIGQMRSEARHAIEKIAAQLFAADCSALRSGVEDLRQAAQDTKWPRAVYRCQECKIIAYRLSHDLRLADEEKSKLLAAADDPQLILRFIEKNRLNGQGGDLQNSHVQSLDNAIVVLARIQARFHHQLLQAPEHSTEPY